jgi:hypothetical protein
MFRPYSDAQMRRLVSPQVFLILSAWMALFLYAVVDSLF